MKRMFSIRRVSPAWALSVVLISPAAADNVANLKASSAQMSRISANPSPEAARASAFSGHQAMMGAKNRGAVNARDYVKADPMVRSDEAIEMEIARRLGEERHGLKTGGVPELLSVSKDGKRKPSRRERAEKRMDRIKTALIIGAVVSAMVIVGPVGACVGPVAAAATAVGLIGIAALLAYN